MHSKEIQSEWADAGNKDMNQSKYPLILPQEPAWQRRSEDAGMQHPGPRCPAAKARRGVLVGGVGEVVIARYST